MQRKEMLGKYLEALSKFLMVLQMCFEKQASLHFRLLTQLYLGFAYKHRCGFTKSKELEKRWRFAKSAQELRMSFE
mgnify:CR=1 FL=1